jgi:hypothetical protein
MLNQSLRIGCMPRDRCRKCHFVNGVSDSESPGTNLLFPPGLSVKLNEGRNSSEIVLSRSFSERVLAAVSGPGNSQIVNPGVPVR